MNATGLSVDPPRNGDEDYRTSHNLLGTIVTNMSKHCDPIDDARLRTSQAKWDCGYRWIRHANRLMGWKSLMAEPTAVDDINLQFPQGMWYAGGDCQVLDTNNLGWWANLYSQGVDDQFRPLYMNQIWRFDILGPEGAGWTWADTMEFQDPDNEWTGDYFAMEGLFSDPVESGMTRRLNGPNFPITEVWSNWIGETARIHFDCADSANAENQIQASFKRWMIFNEPFLRGLFPHNAVRLFKMAKSSIRAWDWYQRPVFIGGVSGPKGPDYGSGYTNRPPNPMSVLERHYALMAYGAAPDPVTIEVQNTYTYHSVNCGSQE